ncbi:TPA: hypothetical protein ACGCHN_004311 [Stenotrophomonas maltophilia]|uniref:hypothetical protein n=1 Tax=Stenotrophomonas maltophilia TaxID=40324 RepID=UPI000C1508D6|nr:hypothetical protein [Stenotrophomonas maltophilia]
MHNLEAEIICEPKNFSEAHQELVEALADYAPHGTSDSSAIFVRKIRIDHAEDMLAESKSAEPNSETAWYFLTEAARSIGFLIASQHATYARDDEEDLHTAARKNGSAGGTAKGVNGRKVIEDIVKKILDAHPPREGWDKASLKRKYNEITAELKDFKNSEKKFRDICKRDDVQSLLTAKRNR